MNKQILKHLIRYILMICIIVLCVKIFNFSSENGKKSSVTSGKVAKVVVSIINRDKNLSEGEINLIAEEMQPQIRKTAHFLVYMLLGVLVMLCAGEFRDVCLDTVGALIGILIILLIDYITNLCKKSKTKKLSELNNKDKKRSVLFIASTGGHLSELMQTKSLFKQYNYHIVTEKTKVDDSLKEEYGDKISFLIYGTKKYLIRYLFKFLANCFISLFYFFRYQPEVVVTTGTHTAVPMCYIAKIFGSKVIFIETFANRTTKTVSGKLVYPIADTFVVQWDEMLKLYPK